MKCDLNKSAKVAFKRGKLTKRNEVTLNNDTVVKNLEQKQTCKYLGINEGQGIQLPDMNKKIRKNAKKERVRTILKTEVKVKKRITAINKFQWSVTVFI